jgi:hypothetical protein
MSKFIRFPIVSPESCERDLRQARRYEMFRWLAYSLFCMAIGIVFAKLIL